MVDPEPAPQQRKIVSGPTLQGFSPRREFIFGLVLGFIATLVLFPIAAFFLLVAFVSTFR